MIETKRKRKEIKEQEERERELLQPFGSLFYLCVNYILFIIPLSDINKKSTKRDEENRKS